MLVRLVVRSQPTTPPTPQPAWRSLKPDARLSTTIFGIGLDSLRQCQRKDIDPDENGRPIQQGSPSKEYDDVLPLHIQLLLNDWRSLIRFLGRFGAKSLKFLPVNGIC